MERFSSHGEWPRAINCSATPRQRLTLRQATMRLLLRMLSASDLPVRPSDSAERFGDGLGYATLIGWLIAGIVFASPVSRMLSGVVFAMAAFVLWYVGIVGLLTFLWTLAKIRKYS